VKTNPNNNDGSFVIRVSGMSSPGDSITNGISRNLIDLLKRIYTFDKINNYEDGNRPVITSGFRGKKAQADLRDQNENSGGTGKVAKNSKHSIGQAIDIRSSNLDCKSIDRLMSFIKSDGKFNAIHHGIPNHPTLSEHIHVEEL